jgi:two-component system OmpR family response regulator
MKALVAEDNAKVGHFVAQVLREQGHLVDECWTGTDALRLVRAGPYDLVVIDAGLTDIDGFAVVRTARRDGVYAPMLMLGVNAGPKDRALGLESGADDFLTKPFAVEELLARSRALLRRRALPRRLVCGDLTLDRIDCTVTLAGSKIHATAREFAILVYLAGRPDRVVTRLELVANLWDASYQGGTNGIDVHLSHLRAKLGPYRWMIKTVRGKGYRLRPRREA